MSDRKKSPVPTTPPTATSTAVTPVRRTTSWSNIAALEGDAAAVVAEDRPLPDSARSLVDVAQKAKKARLP